jgi:hypothetical protein
MQVLWGLFARFERRRTRANKTLVGQAAAYEPVSGALGQITGKNIELLGNGPPTAAKHAGMPDLPRHPAKSGPPLTGNSKAVIREFDGAHQGK